MSKGGSGDTTVQQTSDPWIALQPYLRGTVNDQYNTTFDNNLTGLMQAAYTDVFQNPTTYYPGQTYADFSPQSQSALDAIYARASNGSPVTSTAQQSLVDTMSGKYLGEGNPYLSQLAQSMGDTIQQQTGSRFAASGRSMGSPAEVQTFQRSLADALAPYQYNAYNTERDNMAKAAALAPSLAASDYTDLNNLRQVGTEYDTQAQKGIDEAMARYYFPQQEALQRLQNYAGLLGSSTTGGTSSQTTSGASPNAFDYASLGTSMLPLGMMAYSMWG